MLKLPKSNTLSTALLSNVVFGRKNFLGNKKAANHGNGLRLGNTDKYSYLKIITETRRPQ
ncbi:hypothetical protein OKN36_09670 [Furfurilactobacillus sp. OKN36]